MKIDPTTPNPICNLVWKISVLVSYSSKSLWDLKYKELNSMLPGLGKYRYLNKLLAVKAILLSLHIGKKVI